MGKRYKITLNFEIDADEPYNDYEYMKDDFYGELSCCVNMPDYNTFQMTVEEIDDKSDLNSIMKNVSQLFKNYDYKETNGLE